MLKVEGEARTSSVFGELVIQYLTVFIATNDLKSDTSLRSLDCLCKELRNKIDRTVSRCQRAGGILTTTSEQSLIISWPECS